MSFRHFPLIGSTVIVGIVFYFIGKSTSTRGPAVAGDAVANLSPAVSAEDSLSQDSDPSQPVDWKILLSGGNRDQSVASSLESLALAERLRAWAEEDPLAALGFAKEHVEPASEVRKMLREILDVWAHNDPLAAWTWAEEDSHFHLNRLLKVMGEVAPELAWEKAQVFAGKEEHADIENIGYLSAIRGMLHFGNYAEAIDLFETSDIASINDNPVEEHRFLETILNEWTLYEPEKALAWANSLDENSSVNKADALNTVVDTWAYADPEQVIAFAQQTSDPALAEKALSIGIFSLSEHQPEKAAAWLNGKEAQPAFDDAYRNLAMNTRLLRADPAKSISLMAAVSDPDVSNEGIISVGEQWYQFDPSAAEQFFQENTSMSDEDRAELAEYARSTKENIEKEKTYNGWD